VFQPERQQQFLTLAPNGAVGRKENILGQLLGDGAAALNQTASTDIGDDGAHQALGIDAEMAVEAAVFRRQQGIGEIGGQFVEIDLLAVEVPIARQNLPIGRDQGDAGPPCGVGQAAQIRQVIGKPGDETKADEDPPDRQHGGPFEQACAQPAGAAPGPGLALLALVFGFTGLAHVRRLFRRFARLLPCPPESRSVPPLARRSCRRHIAAP
jgi:hypothetical protein